MTPKKKMEWLEGQHRIRVAISEADTIVEQLRLAAPINPFRIIHSEKDFLRAGGGDFKNQYDGKLDYQPDKNLFLLFYNNKYDIGRPPKDHHPRTRFSISHELGHYFLPKHRAYLMKHRESHGSRGEFRSDIWVEREADAFASAILLPTKLARPLVNEQDLSVARLRTIAGHFNASLVSTMFRAVSLSDFPCAVAGIRSGKVAWMFTSESLIAKGIYPNRGFLPDNASEPWAEFQVGLADVSENDGCIDDWFQSFDENLDDIEVHEEYLPVASMKTLLVLLTIREDDLNPDDDDNYSEDDYE